MDNAGDAALRRWAVKQVLSNGNFETFQNTAAVCRLAMELVEFVKTGSQPPLAAPAGTRHH